MDRLLVRIDKRSSVARGVPMVRKVTFAVGSEKGERQSAAARGRLNTGKLREKGMCKHF